MSGEFRQMFKAIKLTPLEHAVLRDCVEVQIDGCKETMFDLTNREASLDLSSLTKRQYATDIACALVLMAAAPEGWAKTKKRRDACVQLAAKFNAAVDAAPALFGARLAAVH